jgi:hypothetical protein
MSTCRNRDSPGQGINAWRRERETSFSLDTFRVGSGPAALRQHLCISFGVMEYQHSGLVHAHAVIRIDGRAGPDNPAPWASTDLLPNAVLTAAQVPAITLPHLAKDRQPVPLTWGSQVDVRIVRRYISGELDDRRVAS